MEVGNKVKYVTNEGVTLKHTHTIIRIEGETLVTKSPPCKREILIPVNKAVLVTK